jgi:RecA/RadA recombinase
MRSQAVFQLETLLQARQFDRTIATREEPESVRDPTGIRALDLALGGGWRQGEVSEVVGGRSSGRTSVLVSTLASAAARGGVVGLVDAIDRFDPVTAAAAGLDLDRVLWVRGPQITVEHARSRLVDHAIHQAVRALDLLVRAGGFAVVALDVADLPARRLRALPLATWMRLAHVTAGQPTVCLLAGEAAMGRSARGASVTLEASARWTGASPQSRRLAGLDVRARVLDAHRVRETQFRTLNPEP